MIEETFKNTIKHYDLLEHKDRLILGVSGGPDSIFMLQQFYALAKDYKLQLVCAHFNHMLRLQADAEEQFVKEVCKDLEIKFVSEKKDVNKFFKGDSLEQTARNLRFDFFLKISRHFKIKKIALAHHRDDLIETMLMRLLRGSGLRGLRGFLPKSKYHGLTIIRPLIELNKEDILKWLEAKKINFCLDKSNFEEKFLRNRIRLKLIPLLKEFNPAIVDNLSSLSQILCLDYDFMYTYSQKIYEELKISETRCLIRLGLEKLKSLHPAILNSIIRIAIENLKGNTRRIELRHIEEVRDLILKRPLGSIVHLPDLAVKKEEKALIIQSLIL